MDPVEELNAVGTVPHTAAGELLDPMADPLQSTVDMPDAVTGMRNMANSLSIGVELSTTGRSWFLVDSDVGTS